MKIRVLSLFFLLFLFQITGLFCDDITIVNNTNASWKVVLFEKGKAFAVTPIQNLDAISNGQSQEYLDVDINNLKSIKAVAQNLRTAGTAISSGSPVVLSYEINSSRDESRAERGTIVQFDARGKLLMDNKKHVVRGVAKTCFIKRVSANLYNIEEK